MWCIDGTVIRAARAAGGAVSLAKKVADEPEDHALGRSQGGFGTKVHLVSDGHGIPLAVTLTPAPQPLGQAGRRQGVQLWPDPAVAGPAWGQGGDPPP